MNERMNRWLGLGLDWRFREPILETFAGFTGEEDGGAVVVAGVEVGVEVGVGVEELEPRINPQSSSGFLD